MIDYKKLAGEYDYHVGDEDVFEAVGSKVATRGYMNKDEFLKIVRWKAARSLRRAHENSPEKVEEVSKRAFSTTDDRERIKILCELRGVAVRMASAILTIVYPEKYGVVDIRAWRALSDLNLLEEGKKNRDKNYYSIDDYLLYLDIIRQKAKEYGITPREVDKALWKYDEKSSCR
jgi:thermostable 8-oxoguanine DNA glycosylase